MDIYKLLKTFGRIRSRRLKLLAIYLLHTFRRRLIGIYIDPVLGCNYRCRMCYFSDENRRKELQGVISDNDLEQIAKALFHRALKLQIGCGAEPTISRNLEKVIRLGKKYGVPYISVTTNGKLINQELLGHLIEEGLDEITLSCHGLKKKTYEMLMPGGDYEHFMELMHSLSSIKEQYPGFKIRLNYTMNEDNTEELSEFPEIFGDVPIDILQLRPIQQIGDSEYKKFDLRKVEQIYNRIIPDLLAHCNGKGMVCMTPGKDNFVVLENQDDSNEVFEQLTYCYISPKACWREDFDPKTETYESYSRKTHRGRFILGKVFEMGNHRKRKKNKTIKMNYTIR